MWHFNPYDKKTTMFEEPEMQTISDNNKRSPNTIVFYIETIERMHTHWFCNDEAWIIRIT